jgi:hypothetical protein
MKIAKGRRIDVIGIEISSDLFSCRGRCRYCLLGRKGRERFDHHRFLDLVERFIDWAETDGRKLRILHGMEHSSEYGVDALKRQLDLNARLGWADATRGIRLGGLAERSGDDLGNWLRERRDRAGIRTVHASLAGEGATHDRWHGRPGDFERLYRTMAVAAELELRMAQRLFLIRDTLADFDRLLDRLDVIGGHHERYLCLFYYRGLGSRLEEQRITEDIRDSLPPRLAGLDRRGRDGWRSEREWLDLSDDDDAPLPVHLKLKVTDANIGELERSPCAAIVRRLEVRTRAAYSAIPPREELGRWAGDRRNHRIYMGADDIERKWLDIYLRDNPVGFERHLTHLAAGS